MGTVSADIAYPGAGVPSSFMTVPLKVAIGTDCPWAVPPAMKTADNRYRHK